MNLKLPHVIMTVISASAFGTGSVPFTNHYKEWKHNKRNKRKRVLFSSHLRSWNLETLIRELYRCSLMNDPCGCGCGNSAFPTQNAIPPPILHSLSRNEHEDPDQIMVASPTSWLRSRRIRYCFLLLCSPLLVPFLCVTFPLLCAANLCLRVYRRRRRRREDARLLRCEEGCGGVEEEEEEKEGGMGLLLQRYLEDQMLLVGSVYECGDADDDGEDPTTPLLA